MPAGMQGKEKEQQNNKKLKLHLSSIFFYSHPKAFIGQPPLQYVPFLKKKISCNTCIKNFCVAEKIKQHEFGLWTTTGLSKKKKKLKGNRQYRPFLEIA